MTVMCVLQARMTSSRLPGKVLLPILGVPMLALQIERIQRARRLDTLTVATSDQASDDPIAALCASLDVDRFRGDLDDVLDRFYQAASVHRPNHVVRLTGDCPLIDPQIVDALVELHVSGGYDYSSNVHPRTFPDGLDAEIFTFEMLEEAWRVASSPAERSHVTPYMYAPGSGVRRGSLQDIELRDHLRWTVDYPDDFEFVRQIFEALYPEDPAFSAEDVHGLLRARPDIAAIAAGRA